MNTSPIYPPADIGKALEFMDEAIALAQADDWEAVAALDLDAPCRRAFAAATEILNVVRDNVGRAGEVGVDASKTWEHDGSVTAGEEQTEPVPDPEPILEALQRLRDRHAELLRLAEQRRDEIVVARRLSQQGRSGTRAYEDHQ